MHCPGLPGLHQYKPAWSNGHWRLQVSMRVFSTLPTFWSRRTPVQSLGFVFGGVWSGVVKILVK